MNVLLIVLDTVRADALEPYGAPAGASPAIADLARRGAAFPDVFAAGCWTIPSHAALFGGALPRALGLIRAPDGRPSSVPGAIAPHRDRWLPEVLRRAGWSTGAISTNFWLSPLSGFDFGFERFEAVSGGRQPRLDKTSRRERAAWAVEAALARDDNGAAQARDVLERWLGEWRGERFFWFMNVLEAHSPYLPPRPYGDVSRLDRVRAAEEARRHLTLTGIWRACLGRFDVPEAALERMRRLYAGAVRYVDDWIATVLEALDRRGVLDDTLVIVTADHGENLGEGGLLGHGWSLDDRLIRVPFVCAGPGALPRPRSLSEVPAVLAQALDVPGDPWRPEDRPALAVAQFDPPPADPERERHAVELWALDEAARQRLRDPLTVATDGRRKLRRRGDAEELFDLDADPLEVRPLDPAGHDVASLRAALDHPAARAHGPPAGAAPAPPPGGPPSASPEELARLEEQMRLLGYM